MCERLEEEWLVDVYTATKYMHHFVPRAVSNLVSADQNLMKALFTVYIQIYRVGDNALPLDNTIDWLWGIKVA